MLTRRALIGTTLLAGFAGCTGLPSAAQLQADVAGIAAGATTVLADARSAGVLTAAQVTQAQAIVADINTNAAAIANAVQPQTSWVTAVTNGVVALSALLSPFFPTATPVGTLLAAVVSLVGTILQEAGVTGASPAWLAPTMTPAEARGVLRIKVIGQ